MSALATIGRLRSNQPTYSRVRRWIVDLLEDIRQFVLSHLPCLPSARAELEAKDAHELLVIYRNWQERLIRPVPRRVHRSQALLANPLAGHAKHGPALEQIARMLETGEEVTPHLSRNVIHGYQEDASGQRFRKDLDLMLNDWGVHHLHLSAHIESDGFAERTGPLLFAVIKNNDAYLIDIMDHGNWVCRRIFETMVKEWSEAGLAHEMKGVIGLAREVSEADHKTLRAKHVNTFIEVNGKVYMPSRGMAAAWNSMTATMAANQLIGTIEDAQQHLTDNPNYFSGLMRQNGIEPPHTLDLHFHIFDEGGYGVIERQTGVALRLGN